MKRIATLILLIAILATQLAAQTAKELYLNIPDTLMPLLTEVNRADFIDFLESNMRAEVTNRLGGKSEMKTLTDTYISIQTTPQSTWQMKLLPARNGKDTIICVVNTITTPVPDSRIQFFDTRWREQSSTKYLPKPPHITHFILPQPADTTAIYAYQKATLQADLTLMQIDLAPDNTTLTYTLTTPRYMEQKTAETLKPYLRRSITYRWEKGRFLPEPNP